MPGRCGKPMPSKARCSVLGSRTSRCLAFLQPQISAELKYHAFADENELSRRVADLLAAEKVVGWFQGRMEFGPRALGSRSILGDARSERMQSLMNRKIKFS